MTNASSGHSKSIPVHSTVQKCQTWLENSRGIPRTPTKSCFPVDVKAGPTVNRKYNSRHCFVSGWNIPHFPLCHCYHHYPQQPSPALLGVSRQLRMAWCGYHWSLPTTLIQPLVRGLASSPEGLSTCLYLGTEGPKEKMLEQTDNSGWDYERDLTETGVIQKEFGSFENLSCKLQVTRWS